VKFEDKLFKPGQGNNVYIFPGIGLGVTYSHATRVTNRMFLEAARIVADAVTEEDWAAGQIYPSLRRIREVSIRIAAAVSRESVRAGLSNKVLSDHLEEDIHQAIYDPAYPIYV
jgi:malate dehydrogenase (oxaloacetate-decarboxylating)(NADP+)